MNSQFKTPIALFLTVIFAILLSGCSTAPPIPKDQSPMHPLGMGKINSQASAQAFGEAARERSIQQSNRAHP